MGEGRHSVSQEQVPRPLCFSVSSSIKGKAQTRCHLCTACLTPLQGTVEKAQQAGFHCPAHDPCTDIPHLIYKEGESKHMPIAPNIQIRKLRPSADKNLGHIRTVCQWQNWPWNPHFPLLRVGEGQWLGSWDRGR